VRVVRSKELIDVYKVMLRIRLFEEEIIARYPEQEIRMPVHLCIGQEAIPAGVIHHLRQDDYIFSTHRCHGHVIAKGMSLDSLMAELYGRVTGCCRGYGGSMHLADPSLGIPVTTSIVGGGLPIAVGAAWSLRHRRTSQVSVVFFGDGAVDEGVFYESLNFAALKKLPVFFVCENNFYATNSHQSSRQPLDNIYRRGCVFGIPGIRVDGNDIRGILHHSGRLVRKLRTGGGPCLMECRTYRWKGHVGPECDVDKGCRPRKELENWIKKCPILFLERFLIRKKIATRLHLERIRGEVSQEIVRAVTFAKNSPEPFPLDLQKPVFYGE